MRVLGLYEPRGHEARMVRVVSVWRSVSDQSLTGPLVWLADLWFEIVRDWGAWNRMQKAPRLLRAKFSPIMF